MRKQDILIIACAGLFTTISFTACSDSDDINSSLGELVPGEEVFGKANDVFSAAEWYPGG